MQGQLQVSADEAGLRCGGGVRPETLALSSGGGGRGPEARAAGPVAVGSGAAGDRPGSCGQSSRWEGRLAWDSSGGRPGGPLGYPAAALGTVTGDRCARGFPKRPERRGSASGGTGAASGSGAGETRGSRGFSVLWEPRGPRELGVAPCWTCRREVGGGETEGGRGPG